MNLWAGKDVAELNGLGVGIHVVDDTCRYHLGQPSRGLLARTFAHIDDAQDMELLRLLPILVQRALAAGKRGGWGGGWSYELGGERVGCRDGYGGGGAQRGGRNAVGEGKGGGGEGTRAAPISIVLAATHDEAYWDGITACCIQQCRVPAGHCYSEPQQGTRVG